VGASGASAPWKGSPVLTKLATSAVTAAQSGRGPPIADIQPAGVRFMYKALCNTVITSFCKPSGNLQQTCLPVASTLAQDGGTVKGHKYHVNNLLSNA